MSFTTTNNDHLIRSQLWSSELKEVLLDELMAMGYVRMIDFPDGDTLNIPSIGQAEVLDYVEDSAVKYSRMDTGNFQFTITDYVQSGNYITNKMKQDSYVMDQVVASFVPKQARAIMARIEDSIMALGPDGQTAANPNTINGAAHRFIASGTNQVIGIGDFAKAKYALQKANVPMNNLVAIVDPAVEHTINTLTNLVNVSDNPRWEGIIESGMGNGMKFIKNIYGFDVWVSQHLKTGLAETITPPGGSADSVTNGTANLFFSAGADDIMPFIGNMRQEPSVDSEYNKDFQREEYVTTARYGFALYRPENMVCVLSEDHDNVYA